MANPMKDGTIMANMIVVLVASRERNQTFGGRVYDYLIPLNHESFQGVVVSYMEILICLQSFWQQHSRNCYHQ